MGGGRLKWVQQLKRMRAFLGFFRYTSYNLLQISKSDNVYFVNSSSNASRCVYKITTQETLAAKFAKTVGCSSILVTCHISKLKCMLLTDNTYYCSVQLVFDKFTIFSALAAALLKAKYNENVESQSSSYKKDHIMHFNASMVAKK